LIVHHTSGFHARDLGGANTSCTTTISTYGIYIKNIIEFKGKTYKQTVFEIRRGVDCIKLTGRLFQVTCSLKINKLGDILI